MNVFIDIKIEYSRCLGVSGCGKCIQVCPVNIFTDTDEANHADSDLPLLVDRNIDECTLCDLCIQNCEPDVIRITKLYE
jgi:ferredoxin